MKTQDLSKKKSQNKTKTTFKKIKNELKKDAKKLESIPLEYQTSAYKQIQREKLIGKDNNARKQLQALRLMEKKLQKN